MQKLPISLVIIAFNEEKNIKRCIQSVPFVDDIVVVDSFSTDKTAQIAKELGANVHQIKWMGYGRQKRKATELAKNNWVLSLDADEALSPELAAEILEIHSTLNSEYGYQIPRKSFHLGKWIQYGGWYPDYQLRLFNKSKYNWDDSGIHEKVKVIHEAKLKKPILHWVFDSLSDQVKTNDKYSTLGAEQLREKNKNFFCLLLIIKPISKFLECYVFKLGFLDGLAGFIIAVGAGYSVFLKWAKLWEYSIHHEKK